VPDVKARGRQIAAAVVLGGLMFAVGWGLWTVRPVLAPFLLAVGIAYVVAPLVNSLAGRGLHRGWAILIVYGALAMVAALMVGELLPQAVSETRRLAEAIPVYSLRARELAGGLQQRVRSMGMPPELRDVLDRNISDIEVRSTRALQGLITIHTLRQAAGLLASLLLAPFLAFYLLKDIDRFKERFVHALPARHRQEIVNLLRSLDRVLAGFVRGQILLALIVGAMAAGATALLGLRFSLLLGMWAGFTEMVPYVGPILGAIPAVLAALTVSPLLALETVVAFAIIQQIENAVLSPKIMAESVGLHPLVVMLSVLSAGYLVGPYGLILALPVAGVIRVLWGFLISRLTAAPAVNLTAQPAARPEPSAPQGHE
jgi:predicted PurR-regulated permease PerM